MSEFDTRFKGSSALDKTRSSQLLRGVSSDLSASSLKTAVREFTALLVSEPNDLDALLGRAICNVLQRRVEDALADILAGVGRGTTFVDRYIEINGTLIPSVAGEFFRFVESRSESPAGLLSRREWLTCVGVGQR